MSELAGAVFTVASSASVASPVIVTHPQSVAASGGQSVSFAVTASGENLTYQWFRGSTAVANGTGPELTLPSVQLSDAGVYTVRVSNSQGSVVSDGANLTVTLTRPVITWPTPAGIVYGTPLGAAQLNASVGNIPGTFSYSPPAGTVLAPASSHTLSVNFVPAEPGKYESVSSSVTISVARAPLTIRANNLSKFYGSPVPALTVSYEGFVNDDTAAALTSNPSLSTTATLSSPPGAYPISISGGAAANYIVTLVPGTLTVERAPLTVTAANKSKRYAAANPALTFTYSGFVNGDTAARLTTPVTISTTATTASDVGAYPITPAGATSPNYNITFVPGTLTITQAPLTITVQSRQKVYGQALPAFSATYSGFLNGDTAASLDTPVSFTTTATVASPVGVYPLEARNAADRNYAISYVQGIVRVIPANLTIKAQDLSKTYGAPVPQLSATYTGFVLGDTPASLTTPVVLSTTATVSSPVGSYFINASGATSPNYNITFRRGTLTVNRALLEIRADDKTKRVGQPNPPLTYTITGFVLGETEADLDSAPVPSTDATLTSPVGVYFIRVRQAADANYTVRYYTGQMRVIP